MTDGNPHLSPVVFVFYHREAQYGALLGPFLDDPGNLFVISSDFCHWGTRFSYTFYNAEKARFCADSGAAHEGLIACYRSNPVCIQ